MSSKEKFYNLLTDTNISYKDYECALEVWDRFKMNNYHDLYLKCDFLLLADVSEKLRNGLCPCHYLSVEALSWDVIFNTKKFNFNLFKMQNV